MLVGVLLLPICGKVWESIVPLPVDEQNQFLTCPSLQKWLLSVKPLLSIQWYKRSIVRKKSKLDFYYSIESLKNSHHVPWLWQAVYRQQLLICYDWCYTGKENLISVMCFPFLQDISQDHGVCKFIRSIHSRSKNLQEFLWLGEYLNLLNCIMANCDYDNCRCKLQNKKCNFSVCCACRLNVAAYMEFFLFV